jgi:hypothetical protein
MFTPIAVTAYTRRHVKTPVTGCIRIIAGRGNRNGTYILISHHDEPTSTWTRSTLTGSGHLYLALILLALAKSRCPPSGEVEMSGVGDFLVRVLSHKSVVSSSLVPLKAVDGPQGVGHAYNQIRSKRPLGN